MDDEIKDESCNIYIDKSENDENCENCEQLRLIDLPDIVLVDIMEYLNLKDR